MKRVLYIQYTNPAGYPPLQHSSGILADAGWQILFLGTGASGAGTLEFPPHQNITVRQMRFCPPGWQQKLHYVSYCLWVVWMVLTWRPQWIYASDPFSCPVAALLTHFPGLRVLYHEHDTPAHQTGNAFLDFITSARKRIARSAKLCVLPNSQRLARFVSDAGPVKAAVCVWNCPGLYELENEPRNPATADIWLLYHGTLVPERLSPSIIDALALLPPFVKLRAVGYETVGAPGYVAQLRSQAAVLGLVERVEFLPPVSRNRLFAITLRSDIGLAMIPSRSSDQNFEAMTGASNKVFDYLACGLPVIVSEIPEWRKMFVESGYGAAADPADARSIAAAIRHVIESPETMRAMGEAGRQRILHDWNYEAVFQPVLQAMEART